MIQAVLVYHNPTGARLFVVPLIDHLARAGISGELWVSPNDDWFGGTATWTPPAGVTIRALPSMLPANPLRWWGMLQASRRALSQSRPRLLHAHLLRGALVPLLAGCLERVPIRIYHNHGLPYLGYRGPVRWCLRTLERINMALATHVVMVSRSNRAAALADGLVEPGQAQVLGYGSALGIDLDQFSQTAFDQPARTAARTTLGLPSGGFVIGYVGRPVARKGFHVALLGWEASNLAERGGTLLIAGCTQQEVDQALGHPVPGAKGLGFVRDMTGFYAACDVVTLPSFHEGYPYGMLEAAAAGRACLGSDVPGVRCAVVEGETGLLVPVGDHQALAMAMIRLYEDVDLRERLGRGGRARVEARFSRRFLLSRLLALYRRLLQLPHTGPRTGLREPTRARSAAPPWKADQTGA